MKKQIRILTIVAVAALISFASGAAAAPNTFDANGNLCVVGGTSPQEIGTPMELWMGVGNESAGTLVGYATFDSINSNVVINLTDADGDGPPDLFPYVLTAVHIHFAPDVESLPHTNNGNPIPGQFEYSLDFLDGYDSSKAVLVVPVSFDAVGAIHITAVKYGGLEGFGRYLDEALVEMSVTYPQPGDPSYLEMIITESGFLDGVYESWCVDADTPIDNNTVYSAQLYSSYEPLPAGLFEHPENFDKVNYLLNNFEVGQMVQITEPNCTLTTNGCGSSELHAPEPLTYGDVQRAIWTLIDDNLPTAGLGPWWQKRVDAILCDVNTNGGGFIPTCDDKTVFIVVPVDGEGELAAQLVAAQTKLSTTEIPCEDIEETAWGDGKYGERFSGAKQWGTYFNYDAACVPVP